MSEKSSQRIGRVVNAVPLAAAVLPAYLLGMVLGYRLFPFPPYGNVGPAIAVSLVLLFASLFGGLEVKSRYA